MKEKQRKSFEDACVEMWSRLRSTPRPELPVAPDRLIRSCPLNGDWRQWDSATPQRFRLEDPAAQRRAVAAQAARRGRLLCKVDARWERAADDACSQPDRDPRLSCGPGSPCHVHTSLELENRRIHIDRLMIERFGPGRIFIEYRIYIDGMVSGRGGICGGPYGNGNSDLPAVAFLTPRLILSVDRDLNIHVWEHRPLKDKA